MTEAAARWSGPCPAQVEGPCRRDHDIEGRPCSLFRCPGCDRDRPVCVGGEGPLCDPCEADRQRAVRERLDELLEAHRDGRTS